MIAHGEELSFLKKYDQFRSLGFGSLISLGRHLSAPDPHHCDHKGLFVVVSEPIAVTAHKTRVHYYYYVMDASSKREYIKSAPPLFPISWKLSKYGC
ncbi:hypothetical protein DTO212C5_5274 [Paecilomyces variotii]|nr:hypothetical protein DTO212C5_5274 [Paecilomyces variotii]